MINKETINTIRKTVVNIFSKPNSNPKNIFEKKNNTFYCLRSLEQARKQMSKVSLRTQIVNCFQIFQLLGCI